MRTFCLTVALFLAALAGSAQQPPAAPSATLPPGTVATLDGKPISDSELEKFLGGRLLKVRQQEYQIKSDGLKDYAFQLLEAQEAARQKISVDELVRRNVTAKVVPPTKDAITEIVRRYRSQLPADEEQARAQVSRYLSEQSRQQAETAFRDELLAKAKLNITLEPPRAEVAIDKDDPMIGSASAPVTIVEFSDFQCPYCSHAQETVKQLRAAYGDRIRLVFKQLPLPMHPQARLGAEAALCAQNQGKYWEIREWMFTHQNNLKPDALTAAAGEAKLDTAAFSKCLAGHETDGRIDRDMSEATDLGATGTPTFFVNGRMMEGAQTLASFREVIDQELSRSNPPAPAAATR